MYEKLAKLLINVFTMLENCITFNTARCNGTRIIISLNANKEESKLWDFYSVKQLKARM